jgi:pimeloyl-ACP methyl ester carboxylesterase
MRNFLIVLLALVAGCESGPKIPYVPRDAALRTEPLLFYPARDRPARAFVLFLGNDVGFWKPHEELAWRLAENGYDVVGLDVKKYLAQLPEDEPARDSSFDASIGPLIARARRELGADSLPVVVGGHSFGAEVAFWIALHRPPSRLVGVLAMSPRSTGHLVVTPYDLLNHEASGPYSFSTINAVTSIAPGVRIALVRGAKDPFRRHDAAFVAAGGPRLRYFPIPFANHSLRKLLIAGPIIEHAVEFLIEPRRMDTIRTASVR